jgi:hypothetical protein
MVEDQQEQNPAHTQHTPVFLSPCFWPDPKWLKINRRKILRMPKHIHIFISPCFRPDPEWLKINRRKVQRMHNILLFLIRHALGRIQKWLKINRRKSCSCATYRTPFLFRIVLRPDPEWLKINRSKILHMRNILLFLFRHALGRIPSG